MSGTILPALIVFGGMFAITMIGLMASNAAANRLHGSNSRNDSAGSGQMANPQFAPAQQR